MIIIPKYGDTKRANGIEKFEWTSLLQLCHKAFSLKNKRKKQYLRRAIKENEGLPALSQGNNFMIPANCPFS